VNEGSSKREGPVAAAIEPTISAAAELEALFRAQHARILKAAYRITGSMSDAEDVAQNVFLRIAQRGSCRTAMDNPDSYVYRAAINGALDLLRKRQRENAAPADEIELVADSASTERAAQAREAVAALRKSLAELSPRAAEMFVLRYVEERDLADIARLMETSRAVVAVTLHRVRTRLRKQLTSRMRRTP
jgi:RNA polymerase sigma-70 factor (ECF subfamily)